ncbi:GTPase IMAP family member 9-like [Crassostrea virginica]
MWSFSLLFHDIGQNKDGRCTKISKDSDSNEIRILLIGKTGAGKSCTGNTLLDFKAFASGISAKSVTERTQYNETKRFGKKLVVVDTPGYLDTNRSEKEILMEIFRWYSLVSPGIHAIILVVPIDRFTEEDQKTVDFFMKVFGEDLKNYLIVVFTHKNRLEEENMTVDDYVKTLEASSNLRKLINECKNRYTAIGYKGNKEDRTLEVKQILSMVEDIAGKDGKNYYSNEGFLSVQRDLEEKERKRKEEIIKTQSYTREEIKTLLDNVRKQTREEIVKEFNQKESRDEFYRDMDIALRLATKMLKGKFPLIRNAHLKEILSLFRIFYKYI